MSQKKASPKEFELRCVELRNSCNDSIAIAKILTSKSLFIAGLSHEKCAFYTLSNYASSLIAYVQLIATIGQLYN